MKKYYLVALLLLFQLQGCGDKDADSAITGQGATDDRIYYGTVTEIIEVDNYTYLHVSSDAGMAWIATSLVWVNEGDRISFTDPALMEDFHSTTLDRTFDEIYFVQNVELVEAAVDSGEGQNVSDQIPPGHPALPETPAPGQAQATAAIAPPEDGMSVADIYAAYPGIGGTNVRVKGSVVKFSPNIMGSHWITLSDGTGSKPDDVLVVKASETADIGEIITVSGTVKTDVSLGYGYDYKILLEDTTITR